MRNEKGFTLIELMIVVSIIGILAAIAIPQFSAYRVRAYKSEGYASVPNGMTVIGDNASDILPRHLPVKCRY